MVSVSKFTSPLISPTFVFEPALPDVLTRLKIV